MIRKQNKQETALVRYWYLPKNILKDQTIQMVYWRRWRCQGSQ